MPVVSITILSKSTRGSARPTLRRKRRLSPSIRSPWAAQQMQPLVSSSMSSLARAMRSPSIPISPNSLTMTAILPASGAPSRRLTSVVLPAPRKPVRSVIGMRSSTA